MDADASPFKAEIVEICRDYNVALLFVASYAHMTTAFATHEWHYVDQDREAVDYAIMNRASAGDVIVTQDIGLASVLLAKKTTVIHPRGYIYDAEMIDVQLSIRYIKQKERRQGKHSKGPRALTEDDRQRFISNLKKILSNDAGI